jgi:hypothetical protein
MIGFIALFDKARDCTLQVTVTHTHTHSHTSVHSHVISSRCSVAASNSGRSPSSGFPNYPRRQLPSSHSKSSQRLNLGSLTQSLTKSTQLTNCRAYNISTRTAQKTPFLCRCLGNGHCLVACFAVVAYQRVCMPQCTLSMAL